MQSDATHDLCCGPDPLKVSWKQLFASLLKIAIAWTKPPQRNGVVKPLPGFDARMMADIGLGELGNDLTDPALRDVAISHEIARLETMDLLGR